MPNAEVNFIVSGLERSGTSLMMQMLRSGGAQVAFDELRTADAHNPRGYFELAGGKIINRLIDGDFDFSTYRGRIVKITAYGLRFLPPGNYKIIYMIRSIDEVLESMQKMGAEIDMEKDRVLFGKLNRVSLDLMERRADIDYITMHYCDIIESPHQQAQRIRLFLGEALDVEKAVEAVDTRLYRNRSLSVSPTVY